MFTPRVVAINESFVPVKHKESKVEIAPIAVIWHEGIMGHNDEDVASSFIKALKSSQICKYKNPILWLDNCAGQNKNWSLITTLVAYVNCSSYGPDTLSLKYLTKGHTYMSADYFHKQVEEAMKRKKDVEDWTDFIYCISKAGGIPLAMDITDFKNFRSGLSHGKTSLETKPLLENVAVAQFRKGSVKSWFYKKNHTDASFEEHTFLQSKLNDYVSSKYEDFMHATENKPLRGVNPKKSLIF